MNKTIILISLLFCSITSVASTTNTQPIESITEPKLIGIPRAGLGHHQNNFIIPADCSVTRYHSRCKQKLMKQNYSVLINYIKDSLKFLSTALNQEKYRTVDNERMLSIFTKAPKQFKTFNHSYCSLRDSCRMGLMCGKGDLGQYDSCVHQELKQRVTKLSNTIKNGFGYGIYVFSPDLKLETKSFIVEIHGACIPPAIECKTLEYYGRSKQNGSHITLSGIPYYGNADTDSDYRTKMLGYFFKNENIEYYVSLVGKLKVYNPNTKKILVEESGDWQKLQ